MGPNPDANARVTALVVADEGDDRSSLVEAVQGLGLVVRVASGFLDAREALAHDPPDVLVTELRLGAYNGLHLALRGKAVRPGMKAIVVTRTADPVLQKEAAGIGAELLVREPDTTWIASLLASIGTITPDGRLIAVKPAEGA